MAVRWNVRRLPAPAPADDGRWGVARLAAQRAAAARAGRDEPTDDAAPDVANAGSVVAGPPSRPSTGPAAREDGDGDGPEESVPGPRRPVPDREPPPGDPGPPAPRRAPGGPLPGPPAPRRPRGGEYRPPALPARPRVDPEPGLIGFSRLTRGRTGSRVFVLCFVLIYAVIVIQTLSQIL